MRFVVVSLIFFAVVIAGVAVLAARRGGRRVRGASELDQEARAAAHGIRSTHDHGFSGMG